MKLTAPSASHVGQTRSVSVALSDGNYPETAQVQLLVSSPTGWNAVGTSMQSVPVRGGGRTTEFTFNYTFAPTDGTIGKVSFRAVATTSAHEMLSRVTTTSPRSRPPSTERSPRRGRQSSRMPTARTGEPYAGSTRSGKP